MLNGGARPRTVPVPRARKRWIPPSFGALKINVDVDGAFLHESGKAAVGVIIRDHGGCVKLTAWRLLLHVLQGSEEAEATACREGIAMVACWPDLPMVLEMNVRLLLRS
jgi:hypothetical protein